MQVRNLRMTNSPKTTRSFPERLFISPDERRLRAGWRLMLQIVLLLMLGILIQIPVDWVMHLLAPNKMEMVLVTATIISFLAITLSVYFARRMFDRRSFTSLGVNWDSISAKDLGAGIVISGILVALIYLVEWGFGWLEFQGFSWQTIGWKYVGSLLVVAILVWVLVGWSEELVLRGYWLQNLRDGTNLSLGVLLSSVVFAFGHFANPNLGWEALIGLFVAGLFFAFAYLRTNLLWMPIGLHIGWNFFESSVFGFPVSGLDYPSLISQTGQGPAILTGGNFGPEAGMIMLPAILLGIGLIYIYTRSFRQNVPMRVSQPPIKEIEA